MRTTQYDILIQDCTLLTPEMCIEPHRNIAILGGSIAAVGGPEVAGAAAEVIDGRGKLFMPGLVDSHTHVCQQLLRGRVLDELPMIWTRIMLPFESALTAELVEISAQLACLEMIKAGTTAFTDAGGRFMERAAEVAIQAGLRATLTCSTIDLGNLPPTMKTSAADAIAQNTALYHNYHGAGGGRIQVFFSVRSMLSCSEALTVQVFEEARRLGTGIHAHISEYPNEVSACLEAHKLRPLEYLDSLGALGPDFLAAHCILLSDREISIAAVRGVKVVHCPFSNCGKGVPPTPRLLEQGVSVGMGSDGAAHGGLSLWNEMKIFRAVMNAHLGVPLADPTVMPAKTLLQLATCGGAAAQGLGGKTGAVAPGYRADLISIGLEQPHILPSANLVNTLLETVHAGDVMDMLVDGRQIMRNRMVLTLDEAAILARARSAQEKLFPAKREAIA